MLNCELSLKYKIIFDLIHSPYYFHLTGSRYFETANENSDWDFFVSTESNTLEFWLKSYGFQRISGEYNSQDITAVYRQDNVDIQITTDAVRKENIQKIIKENKLYTSDKKYMKNLWNCLFRLYKM